MMNIPSVQTLKQMRDESPTGATVKTTDKAKVNTEEAGVF